VITLYSGHVCVYYASMLRCWHLVWILVRTDHPCLGVGCHSLPSSESGPPLKQAARIVPPPLPLSSNQLVVLTPSQALIERLIAARTEHVAPELLPSPNRLTVRIIERSPSSHAGRSSPCRRTPSSTPEPRRATGSTHLAAAHRRAILLIYGEPPPPLLCLESIAFAHLLLSPVQPSRALLAAVQASPVQSATVPRSLENS
jgi:hypothetical protein